MNRIMETKENAMTAPLAQSPRRVYLLDVHSLDSYRSNNLGVHPSFDQALLDEFPSVLANSDAQSQVGPPCPDVRAVHDHLQIRWLGLGDSLRESRGND